MTTPSPDTVFTEMAERIKRNSPSEFAGAYVIVSPSGDIIISSAMFDPAPNPVAFWGAVKTRVEIAASEFLDAEARKEQNRQIFGQR